jgi:hypothetical protein
MTEFAAHLVDHVLPLCPGYSFHPSYRKPSPGWTGSDNAASVLLSILLLPTENFIGPRNHWRFRRAAARPSSPTFRPSLLDHCPVSGLAGCACAQPGTGPKQRLMVMPTRAPVPSPGAVSSKRLPIDCPIAWSGMPQRVIRFIDDGGAGAYR